MYFTPSSFSPLNVSIILNCFPTTPEMNTPTNGAATIQASLSTFALTYSNSGLTMTAKLKGMVHGVVVHMMRNSLSLPTTGNFKKIESSDTSLYSNSCFANAVWHDAHHGIVRNPRYNLFFSSAFFTNHHSPFMNSSVMD